MSGAGLPRDRLFEHSIISREPEYRVVTTIQVSLLTIIISFVAAYEGEPAGEPFVTKSGSAGGSPSRLVSLLIRYSIGARRAGSVTSRRTPWA